MFTSRTRIFAMTALTLAILALTVVPSTATAAEWRVFGSLTDTDDLAEAFGGGLRASWPINDTWDFDISAAYYEDFKNRWENNTHERTSVELSFIPADFGFTWTQGDDSGFQAGAGLTWAYLDINDINIEGVNAVITGAADNEFGGYVKLGYQAAGGFFAEGMYRILDVSVENLTIDGVGTGPGSDELEMSGYTINLGWRF
jgi:hypothetical protein